MVQHPLFCQENKNLTSRYLNMKVLIIEDDEVWSQQLALMLNDLPNAQLAFATSIATTRTKLADFLPDVVIADVLLADGLAFELFNSSKRTYPIIFMTAHANQRWLEQSLDLPHATFIVKPFHTLTLIAVIRSLIEKMPFVEEKSIEVLGKFKQKLQIPLGEITHVEADGNYMKLYTANKVYSHKSSLKELMSKLDERFVQIHKSYIININYAKRIDLSIGEIYMSGKPLPIGRAYRQQAVQELIKVFG